MKYSFRNSMIKMMHYQQIRENSEKLDRKDEFEDFETFMQEHEAE